MRRLNEAGVDFKDLKTSQSSLEDIFVGLVRAQAMNLHGVRAIYWFELLALVPHADPELGRRR